MQKPQNHSLAKGHKKVDNLCYLMAHGRKPHNRGNFNLARICYFLNAYCLPAFYQCSGNIFIISLLLVEYYLNIQKITCLYYLLKLGVNTVRGLRQFSFLYLFLSYEVRGKYTSMTLIINQNKFFTYELNWSQNDSYYHNLCGNSCWITILKIAHCSHKKHASEEPSLL